MHKQEFQFVVSVIGNKLVMKGMRRWRPFTESGWEGLFQHGAADLTRAL